MDRERWFKVVMGEKYDVAGASVERLSRRLPIPQCKIDELILRLDVAG
jgi:hypothetical protein